MFVLVPLPDECNSDSSVISAEDIISTKESVVDMDSIEGVVIMFLLVVAFKNCLLQRT